MSKIYFQGTYGAYSHLAALSIEPDAKIIPCKTFDECFLKASKDTFTETLIGRKRYIRELNSSNFQVKAAGKRIAMNAPIQGTAADIMKIAMIKVVHKIKELDQTELLLQIHDEIIIETKNSLSSKVEKTIISEMEKAMKLDVPLFVNTKVSGSLANFNN